MLFQVIYLTACNNYFYNILLNSKNIYSFSIMYTFRGTKIDSLVNWYENIDMVKTKYHACEDCYIHEGF